MGVLVFLNLLQNFSSPDFVEFVLGSFLCFYTEIAYSNFTFCGAYTLSFQACHTIPAKRAQSSINGKRKKPFLPSRH